MPLPLFLCAALLLLTGLLLSSGCQSADTLEALEPFRVVKPLSLEEVYVEVLPARKGGAGAMISVNEGEWTDAATVRQGDRIDVGYSHRQDPTSLHYQVLGPTRTGFVIFEEYRWYRDGYPADQRTLRVSPYELPPPPPGPR